MRILVGSAKYRLLLFNAVFHLFHDLTIKQFRLQNAIEEVEENERDAFLKLSASMRDSYEKERARVERTKNWSLIGTVIGTIIGIVDFYA